MRETLVGCLGWEAPLEKEMAPHSSTLAWKNPMDGRAWWATVHGITKSRTPLSNFTKRVMPSLVAQTVKCLPAMWETWFLSLDWEAPLEKEMAPHSSTLAWKNPMDGGAWCP